MAMIDCACLNCGKSFQVIPARYKDGRGKYCSKACIYAHKNSKVHRICKGCGKTFTVYPSQVDECCSLECSYEARRIQINLTCEHCGKAFRRRKSDVKHKRNYCSPECFSKSRRLIIKCNHCGKSIERWIGEAKRQTLHYCDKACWKAYVERLSNSWGFGIRKSYRGVTWYKQRNLAYKRDGGVCQLCHRRQRKSERAFSVHHITPYRLFNGNHFEANRLSNLITLCPQCHVKAEHGFTPVPIPLL